LPVRDGADLLRDCLDALQPEADGVARVTVVDDRSTDGTAGVARAAGVAVISSGTASGPYAARNVGWRAAPADVIVFLDVRCRPRVGWLTAMLDALSADGVAIAGGEVVALTGNTVAERYVASRQPLSPRHSIAHPFLPYVPTASLAIRREVLESVGGFREVRSGGDLDLCWRVQLAGLGRVVLADAAIADWVSRPRLRDLLRQWHRYGLAKARLHARFRDAGATVNPPTPIGRLVKREVWQLGQTMSTQPVGQWPVEAVDRLCILAWELGYRQSFQQLHSRTDQPL
jgi:GT2 family glycosyltransferase